MKITRIASKKNFNFDSLPFSDHQVHIVSALSAKAFEKTIPEALQSQFETSKTEWKENKTTTLSLQSSEGGSFKIIAFPKDATPFALHTALRKFLGAFFKKNESTVHVNLGQLSNSDALFWTDAMASLAICEQWEQPKITNVKKKDSPKEYALNFYTQNSPAAFEKQLDISMAVAEANGLVRTLASMPGNYLTPKLYREEIKKFALHKKVKFEFWDRKELLKLKAGAFLAVTQADPNDMGGIAKVVYKPRKAKNKNVLTLVGKGLCFDTGGYNVKTGSHMFGMHEDMTGSAIALASLGMLADLDYPLEVHAYLAIAENHVSPQGFKPNDVVTASNGKTIEVENTDAEGRMVLSDTLALASKEKPGLIVDYATLTGACFRALSTRMSGVFTNRPQILNTLNSLGHQCGERVWGFPIGEDFEEGLKSEVADILQCSHELNADHIFAATFLNHFVEKDVPWVHVDLSAHSQKGGLGLVSTETNGWGCRFTYAVADAFLKKSLFK